MESFTKADKVSKALVIKYVIQGLFLVPGVPIDRFVYKVKRHADIRRVNKLLLIDALISTPPTLAFRLSFPIYFRHFSLTVYKAGHISLEGFPESVSHKWHITRPHTACRLIDSILKPTLYSKKTQRIFGGSLILTKLKSIFGAQDMTAGSPLRAMMRFSAPLLIGNIAQLMYNTVDAVVVGKMIGENALASIGASAPIQTMFFVFFMTVGTGLRSWYPNILGPGTRCGCPRVGTAMTLTLIATLLITVIGIPLSGPILRLTKVDPSIYNYSNTYLQIVFAGAVGMGFYNILAGILRGLGDSMFPFLVLVGSTVLNVALVLFSSARCAWRLPAPHGQRSSPKRSPLSPVCCVF